MRFLSFALALTGLVDAQMTVYEPQGQVIFGGTESASGTTTASAAAATYTGAAAYDPTVLNAPAVPNPAPNTSFEIQLYSGGMNGLSIQHTGAFYGFSIEMSVSNQILGKNSSFLQVPFLNLLANIVERAGWVQIRVGGNSQESAVLVDSLPNGLILQKDTQNTSGTTKTPPLDYTRDLMYMMNNISSLVNARWFLGIPFFNTTPFSLSIMEAGEAILGDRLLGFQAGNEPDLYAAHQHRPSNYTAFDYFGEMAVLIDQIASDGSIPNRNNILLSPSIAEGTWSPEEVWNTGLATTFSSSLYSLSVERYPTDNCAAQFNTGAAIIQPQDVFPSFLNHSSGQNMVSPYTNSTLFAQQVGKPFMMFETNTASCGGFAGVSNSFGAALWALDYGLQMAYVNFTGALLHAGGQNAYYNPFTPPPTNQSSFRQWTVGPVYYSALVMAEILGPSNTSQVVDLFANSNNIFTPAYAIYENGNPTKVALFNYVTDSSGSSNYTAAIAVGGGSTGQTSATPSSVKVKYLSASSVASITDFTWAGQTFGNNFQADGRLQGNLDVKTVQCDTTTGTCSVQVPAPGFALVFLNEDSFSEVSPSSTVTYPTTIQTKAVNTIQVDPSVLATSNGHSGMADHLGTTSAGSSGALGVTQAVPGALTLFMLAAGAWVVARR
ncbi:hypothetical protein EW146_g2708 [Bondarzewia mesenterica]|uniref:Beta-glucuronidase C-terminal domain-containing protein n=1 Tax=Bondarzewia mesenterica TaxID=1095465 RepID=A0A4S4M0A4_9AGAM|nr:hypothetical protein EW146_g2708 [Bondarzewia mesenterica]